MPSLLENGEENAMDSDYYMNVTDYSLLPFFLSFSYRRVWYRLPESSW